MSDAFARDATAIERIERERLLALIAADIATCERLHADDYELIPPGGGRLSRADYLGMIASGEIRYSVFEPADEVRVRLYERTAIVRYQARIAGEFSRALDEGLFWHTDSYELRDGRWQAVWSQATRIRSSRGLSPVTVGTRDIEGRCETVEAPSNADALYARPAATSSSRVRPASWIRSS